MLDFEITYKSSFCVQWPKIRVLHNEKVIDEILCDQTKLQFSIEPEAENSLSLQWVNKTQKHTKIDNGKIVQDQTFELGIVRVDGILIEDWFITDGYYKPNYFKGYLEQHKNNRTNFPLEEKLPSQKIWHFPGTYYFKEWTGNWWDWYYETKIPKEVVKFTDKDPERIAKYRGTLDPCTDLVDKLKELIK
jgi:hypothetical protein